MRYDTIGSVISVYEINHTVQVWYRTLKYNEAQHRVASY